jgi:hypothetical protein
MRVPSLGEVIMVPPDGELRGFPIFLIEVRKEERLVGVTYRRDDGAWETLRFEEKGHRYNAFDTQQEAVAWILDSEVTE